jgi:hypothetical protein
VKIYLEHEQSRDPATPSPFYEGDVVQQSLSLSVSNRHGGLRRQLRCDRPTRHRHRRPGGSRLSRRDGRRDDPAARDRLASTDTPVRRWLLGASLLDGGTASGIGDIVLRGKYNFLRRRDVGISGAVSVRLPTGSRDDLLGSGVTQVGGYLIVSSQIGRTSPHFNIGYVGVSGGTSDSLYLTRLP